MSHPNAIPELAVADEVKQFLRAAASLLTHGHIDGYVTARLASYGYTPAEMERVARALVAQAASAASDARSSRAA